MLILRVVVKLDSYPNVEVNRKKPLKPPNLLVTFAAFSRGPRWPRCSTNIHHGKDEYVASHGQTKR